MRYVQLHIGLLPRLAIGATCAACASACWSPDRNAAEAPVTAEDSAYAAKLKKYVRDSTVLDSLTRALLIGCSTQSTATKEFETPFVTSQLRHPLKETSTNRPAENCRENHRSKSTVPALRWNRIDHDHHAGGNRGTDVTWTLRGP